MFAIPWAGLTRRGAPLAAFLIALVVYGVVAGDRLRGQSPDPHFVVQAWAWLHGRLDVEQWPVGADDPAVVERAVLQDGRQVRGHRLVIRDVFKVAGGAELPMTAVRSVAPVEYHVAFPPFPAAVMLPLVVVWGRGANDVVATVVLAALAPALCLIVLARLRESGLSQRTPVEEWWLAAFLAFGTVLFFSAVQGRIWFTAHVIAVDLCLLYCWACIDASRPAAAGICLGLAFLTRAPMLFMAPLFVGELWRAGHLASLRRWAWFVFPVACAGALAAWHNEARFGEYLEFGHSYLRARQQFDIERYGLFNLHYVARNAVAAFALLPDVSSQSPWVRVSGHGLAVWVTSPLLIRLAGSKPRHATQYALWSCVVAVGLWTLLYQNTGWFQFGFRFLLDYVVFLVLLLALDERPLTRMARALIVVSVLVNLFGAVTFGRAPQFYRGDRAAYEALVHD